MIQIELNAQKHKIVQLYRNKKMYGKKFLLYIIIIKKLGNLSYLKDLYEL